MQPEQAPYQDRGSFNQDHAGTTFEHGNQIDLHASELELFKAREDINAATAPQPLEVAIQNRLEHQPMLPQDVVRMIGQKVVFDLRKGDLRKGYNDTHIILEEDIDLTAPYMESSDDVLQASTGQVFQFPDRKSSDRHESDFTAA